jgi:hypothetical protein
MTLTHCLHSLVGGIDDNNGGSMNGSMDFRVWWIFAGVIKEVEMFDVMSNKWTIMNKLPAARGCCVNCRS